MDENDLTIEEVLSAEIMVKQVSRVFRYSRNGKQGQVAITMPPEFWLDKTMWGPLVYNTVMQHADSQAEIENDKRIKINWYEDSQPSGAEG